MRAARFRRGVAVVLTVLVGAGACAADVTDLPSVDGSTPASRSAPTGEPCGDIAGRCDPYFPAAGNGGYDVRHYDLDVRYDPAARTITGAARISAAAIAPLARFHLDLHGLTVDAVTVDGARAGFSRSGDELIITPATAVGLGVTFTVDVDYHGRPLPYRRADEPDAGLLIGVDSAIAIGEPEVAASWFPVNDHPSDKATFGVRLTVPDGFAALANGQLVGQESRSGSTTWTWRESAPAAPYLATMVVGRYRVRHATYRGVPMVLAVASTVSSDVDERLAVTPRVLDFLSSWLGPYPFDAVGGIVIDDSRVRYAMETQTRPIYSNRFFAGDADGSWAIAHELAHQWFGDSVTVRDWRQIWLNEGFATYAEWLWRESQGEDSPQQRFDNEFADANADLWRVRPGDPGKHQLFHDSVYVRGAMTLHALRVTVGDAAFRRILRGWATDRAGELVSTTDFVAFAESVSGVDLDALFDEWLFATNRPRRPVSLATPSHR